MSGALLTRVDPSVKLLALTALTVVLLTTFDPWRPAALYVLALLGVGLAARPGARTLLVGQVPFALFAAGTFVVNATTRPGQVLAALGPLQVTDAGVSVGAAFAFRTMVTGVCVIGFVTTTDPPLLLASMRQHLRLPARLSFAVLAGYRVLGGLPEQWRSLHQAHALRRPDPRTARTGRLSTSPALAVRASVGLLVVALRRGERIATTMETRGLRVGPRTTWRSAPLRGVDAAFAAVCVTALTAVCVTAVVTGVAVGPSALSG